MKRRTFLQGMFGAVVVTAPIVVIASKLPVPAATVAVETAAPIAEFNATLIPLIRRTMPSLVANDLLGVQPMTGDTGLVFSMRHYDEHMYVPRNTTGCWGDYII